MTQFSSRVYGPMFSAGLHWWQLGDGQYWGHNTIVRVQAFMDHCGLPKLPGREPLGGEILSHDFVEAALMGRAGWGIWLAYDLGGSWEEVPSTLLEEMKRDRRWCQGNLQHLRLLFAEGLFGAHRMLFLNGRSRTSPRSSGSSSSSCRRSRRCRTSSPSRLLSRTGRASSPSGRSGAPTGRSRSWA
jgi:membrane glycosyltransferase